MEVTLAHPRLWHLDQTSALGRSALDGYNADQKSARSELIVADYRMATSSLTGTLFHSLFIQPQTVSWVLVQRVMLSSHTPGCHIAPKKYPGEIDVINNGGDSIHWTRWHRKNLQD